MPHSRDLLKKPRKVHPNSLKALKEHAVPFKKGDPRINRKGAPNTTSAMRELIRQIGADLIQLQDTTNTGRKRTRIVSRMVKKITDMYESENPADSVAILKAGYPGLLTDEEDKRPKELVLRIVYENKRVIDRDEELVIDGEESEPGQDPGTGAGGSAIIAATTPQPLSGVQNLHSEIETHHTSGEDGLLDLPPEEELSDD